MLLSDIFQQLQQGELSNLSMGNRDERGIRPCDYNKILPHINLGLTELYKRFNLKNNEVVVQQYDHIQTYHLDSRYAQTSIPNPITIPLGGLEISKYYIMDSIYQPFTDDVLRIEAIHNELGEELYINQDRSYYKGSDKYWSVNTPAYNTIQVPYPENENQMIVTYRACHVPIVMDESSNLSRIHVPISQSYLEPLLMYVASRVYTNLGTNEGNEGNNYTAKYEASMQRITELNLKNNEDTFNIKLAENGWV